MIGADNLLSQLGAKCAIQSDPVQTRTQMPQPETEPVQTSTNQIVKSGNIEELILDSKEF